MKKFHAPALRRYFLWVGLTASLLLGEGASALTLSYTPFEFRTTAYKMPPSLDLQINSSQAWQDGALSGAGDVNKIGAGLLVLSGTNTYSGSTTVAAGALQFAKTLSLYNNVPAQWTKLSVLSGAGAYFNVGGAGEFTSANIGALSAAGVFKAGSTLGLETSNAPSSLFSLTDNINAANFAVTKLGLGTLSLSGSNNFAGGFTIGPNYTVVPGQFIYGGTTNSSRVTLASAGALGTSGTITFQGGSLQFTSSNTTDYSSRFSQANGQMFNIDTNGQNVTFASALKAGSFGRLTKTGSGTLTLTALNTPGTVGIQGGALRISAGELNSSVSPGDIEIIDGALLVAGGTVNSSRVYVGSNGSLQNLSDLDSGYLPAARNASATVSSGLWQASSLGIGTHNQTGVVSITGGTLATGYLYVGGAAFDNNGGTGTLNLSGSGALTASEVNIGYTNSVGVANISGGRLAVTGDLNIGSFSGNSTSALLSLSSGTISAANINVGKRTSGTLNVSGGLLSGTGILVIGGSDSVDRGVVNLSGSGTINSSVSLLRTGGGVATLNVNGGVLNAPSITMLGADSTPAQLNVSGGAINSTQLRTDKSVVTISGGTVTTGTFFFAHETSGTSTLNMTGGVFNADTITAFYSQQYNISGGTLNTTSLALHKSNLLLSGSGVVSLNSGSGGLFLDHSNGDGSLNLGGATGSVAATAGALNAAFVSGVSYGNNVVNFNQTGTYTFAPQLLDYLSVTKNGPGTTKLTGANTYTRGTTLNAGTLEIGSNSALGSGLITINGGGLRAAGEERTLTNSVVMAGDFTLGRLTNLAGDVTLTNTITITSANPDTGNVATSIISGPITGAYGLTFATGANPIGKIILSGSNSYSGGTTIQSGTVQIGNSGTTGSVTGNIVDHGSLVFARSDSVNVGNTISGTGSVWQAGAGTLTLSASNSYSGGTVISAGTLGIGGNSALGTGAITITGGGIRAEGQARTLSNALFTGGSFVLGRSTTFTGTTTLLGTTTIIASNPDGPANADSTFGGPIVGNYGVILTSGTGAAGIGSGNIVFSGSNTYTGGTTLSTRLFINGDSALGASSGALTMDGGTLRASTGIVSTRNFILGPGGGTFDLGGGTFSFFSGPVSGSGGLTMSSGFVTLAGPQTYTGATTITGGAVKFSGSSTASSPATSGISVASGASVYFGGDLSYGGTITGTGAFVRESGGTTVLTGSNAYTGGTTITDGVLQLGTGGTTGSITGNVANSGNFRFNRSDAVTFSGVISGTGGVSQVGAGTLTLTGSNSYSGQTAISAGTLQLGNGGTTGSVGLGSISNNATLAINRSDLVTLGNSLSGTGSIWQMGSGTTVLVNGLNLSGTTTISGGVLQIGNGGSFALNSPTIVNNAVLAFNGYGSLYSGVISGSGTLIQNGPGSLVLHGHNTYTGGTVVNAGELILTNSDSLGNVPGALTVNSGTLDIRTSLSASSLSGTSASGVIKGGSSTSFYVTQSVDTTYAGSIQNGDGTMSFRKDGVGTLTLSGSNTYTGTTTIAAGTLRIGNGGTTGSISGSSVSMSSTAATLAFNRSDTLIYGGIISGSGSLRQIGSGTTILAGTNTYSGTTTISGGALQIGNGGTTGSITNSSSIINNAAVVFNRSNNLTHGNTISGSGSVSKLGSGMLTLSGTNTYTGKTTVSAGTMNFAQRSSLYNSNTSSWTAVNLAVSPGATLALGVGGATGFTSSDVNLIAKLGTGTSGFANGSSLGFDTTNGAFTYGGTLANTNGGTNTLGIVKLGANTLTLSGNNSYTGVTTISAGTLQLGNGGTTGSVMSHISIANEATLAINRSDTVTYGGNISGTGSILQMGSGTTILANGFNLAGTGTTTISSGVLQIGTGGSVGSAHGARIVNNGALVFNANNSISVFGVISGSGTLVQMGAGTVMLNTTNSYTGGTVVNAGNLVLGSLNAVGTLTVNSGTFDVRSSLVVSSLSGSSASGVILGRSVLTAAQSVTTTYAGSIQNGSGNLSFVKGGAGTLTLTGSSSYSGGTQVTSGTLAAEHNSAVGTGTVVIEGGVFLIETGVTVGNDIVLSGGTFQRKLTGNLAGAVDATSDLGGGDTMAQILQGTLTASGTLTTSFSATSSALNDEIRLSDVYHFAGTGSDIFVLELSMTGVTTDSILGWRDPNTGLWVNAVAGNSGDSTLFFAGDGAYSAATDFHLGTYGVNTATGSVWAVINHNSDFAVITVPEPGIAGLLACAGWALVARRRLRRPSGAAS